MQISLFDSENLINSSQMTYIKSPVNYTGGKYKLLKYILPLFPTNISTFYDVFGGGGNVAFNVSAPKVICNDYIPHIMNLFSSWKDVDVESYIQYLNSIDVSSVEEFNMLRKSYNASRDLNQLFILLCNSFNYQMRFNSSGEYNSTYAYGKCHFNDNIRDNIRHVIAYIQSSDIQFTNLDFRDIDYRQAITSDFFYFDPPYSLSCGVYQDGKRGFKGWGIRDDLDLFSICDKLNDDGIRFAMSNLMSSKGNTNTQLFNWANKYDVVHIDKSYNLGVRKSTEFKDDEVLIKNY